MASGNCSSGNSSGSGVPSGNETSTQLPDKEQTNLQAEGLRLALQVLLAFIGLIGNVSVIVVMRRLRKKKHTGNFYVQNLAVADLGILTVLFPLAIIKEKIPSNWPFGEFACRYLCPLAEIFYGASVWFVTVIALTRYRKVVTGPSLLGQNMIKRILQGPKVFACGVWLLSFLVFSFPPYFFVTYRELPNHEGKLCYVQWPSPKMQSFYMGGVLTFFSFILPLLIMTLSYLRISHLIRESGLIAKDTPRPSTHEETEDKSLTSEAKVSRARLKHDKFARRIVPPLVLLFTATMLPLSIFRLATVIWPDIVEEQYFKTLFYVISVFVMLNSSVNPMIYAAVSKDFRKEIENLCRS